MNNSFLNITKLLKKIIFMFNFILLTSFYIHFVSVIDNRGNEFEIFCF